MWRKVLVVFLAVFFAVLVSANTAMAVTAEDIDIGVNKSLDMLKYIKGGEAVVNKSEGLLVFPSVFKGAFIVGGEYGEGALVINGKINGYYSTASGSFGLQIGAQKKTIIIAFMDKEALDKFQNSAGWKIGADAEVTVIAVGADGSIDTATTNKPIVGFVFDQKGLMAGLSLKGAKVTKLAR